MPTDLTAFFAPKSVAIVGAGERPTSSGGAVLRNLQISGYDGEIIPINPKGGEIHGLPVRKSLAELATPADLVVVLVRPDIVPDIMRDAAATGHRNVLILPGGFSEAGADGLAREAVVSKIASDAGITIGGPNSAGLVDIAGGNKFAATFLQRTPRGGEVAFISQSGALIEEVVAKSHEMNLKIGTLASVGNAMHIGVTEYLDYLGRRPDCSCVLLYFENLRQAEKMGEIAAEIAAERPVVALLPGRTEPARRAAVAHTGVMPREDAELQRFCDDAGVLRVRSLRSLMLAAKGFGTYPTGIGRNVFLLSNSGGPGVITTDRLSVDGLLMPDLPEAITAKIRPTVPPEASLSNPLDLLADAREDRFAASLEAALGPDGDVYDAILMIHVVPFMVDAGPVIERLAALSQGAKKPLMHAMMGTLHKKDAWFAEMEDAGVPMFNDVEEMAETAALLADYREMRGRQALRKKNATAR